VILPKGSGGLPNEGVALIHPITTIDRALLKKVLGKLDKREMHPIDVELRTILYL
jgi:mRNA-degrading endonuclease toxin of MazEF toxin-antitoxin module